MIAQISVNEALEIWAEPRKIINVSRNLADKVAQQAGGIVVLYTSNSGTIPAVEYQCPGSARWQVNNLGECYSRKVASASTEHAPPSAAQVCRIFGYRASIS